MPPSPNDSNADTIANAIAGRFTYYLVPISLALPHIRDGTLVTLGVSTARRSTYVACVARLGSRRRRDRMQRRILRAVAGMRRIFSRV